MHGSNEWAIAPSFSASGKAMLLSNSHLQWGDIHTYFEVQLTAPGVNSYGAVWVGFPVLRQCFNDYLGWTQTTNNPAESDLYRLTLKDGGYVLDGQVRPFEVVREAIKVKGKDGALREEILTVKRTVTSSSLLRSPFLVLSPRSPPRSRRSPTRPRCPPGPSR